MRLTLPNFFLFLLLTHWTASAADETIRGVLEKTTRPGACAQITDALGDVYFVVKSDESEKAVAPFVGKNQKVVVSGSVEMREGDPSFYFNLKTVEALAPKESGTSAPPAAQGK